MDNMGTNTWACAYWHLRQSCERKFLENGASIATLFHALICMP